MNENANLAATVNFQSHTPHLFAFLFIQVRRAKLQLFLAVCALLRHRLLVKLQQGGWLRRLQR